jgi:sulfide dehydrogenase [flavocytochrome c] flavoprotein subunit
MLRRSFLKTAAGGAFAALQPLGKQARTAAAGSAAEKVVVLGGGFAGAQAASDMKRIAPQLDVTLVDRNDDFIVGPLVFDYLFGKSELGEITVGYDGLRRRGVHVVAAEVVGIDPARRLVRTAGGSLSYTRLILATGTRLAYETIDGLSDDTAANLCAYERNSLVALRQRISQLNDETIVVGIPDARLVCPPAPYEFVLLLAEHIRRKGLSAKIVVLDAGVAPQPQPLAEHFAREIARVRETVEYIDSIGAIQSIDTAEKIVRTSFGDEFKYSWLSVIPQGSVPDFIRDLDLGEVSGATFAYVDPLSMRTRKYEDVFAIGDVAQTPYGKSAFAAVTSADLCARRIAADLKIAEFDQPRVVDIACYPHVDARSALSMKVRYEFVAAPDGDHMQSAARVKEADSANAEERRRWLDGAIPAAFGQPAGSAAALESSRRE